MCKLGRQRKNVNQLKAELETYLELFAHPGWKLFTEEMGWGLNSQKEGLEIADGEDVYRGQGAIRVHRMYLGFEPTKRLQYEQLVANPEEEEDDTV